MAGYRGGLSRWEGVVFVEYMYRSGEKIGDWGWTFPLVDWVERNKGNTFHEQIYLSHDGY